ncbi:MULTISPECIES: 2-hydroxyacid dehydrogenase [Kitasatospora]|uniref:Putative D-lactate dehydrogenase n=1 Tax=Kitasatospora setae (strain ATCC 33774 / DSM 43861 / JCM 3304 / KCC A-0304 / NBRC 14216 / KM-6054) TaxID=452652 RepID=E4N658_KITSK|nr:MULTISPECIES: 2-hydroxyacid dehydrogenase [Kitasatospora]BAJ26689.1 putative D-lactate dehydrogenase [Kitasatospora setae KM-6054]
MEILAYGVLSDERPLLQDALEQHRLRMLDVFLTADTAPLAAGFPVVSSSVNDTLDAGVLSLLAAGGTKLIAQRSTGFNNIDLTAAAELGLTVARVSYYSPYAVAEHAWTLALAVNRRLTRATTRSREFDFRLDGLMGRDIHGMTVGVIGTGKIGECFARIAAGFGTELLGWDVAENPACLELGMTYTELPELLSRADLVSLHVPLLPATHHLIDAAALARMKDDAILVNSSRGGLVDSTALVETLRAGRLSGVGLDVYEEETGVFFTDQSIQGVTDDTLARLVTFPQVLVTSHQAYYTRTAVGQIIDATARNIDDFAAGRTSENTLVPKS